jgi:hypothetical protein
MVLTEGDKLFYEHGAEYSVPLYRDADPERKALLLEAQGSPNAADPVDTKHGVTSVLVLDETGRQIPMKLVGRYYPADQVLDFAMAYQERAQRVWKDIGENAECVVLPGGDGKRLLLTEKMCAALGSALGL